MPTEQNLRSNFRGSCSEHCLIDGPYYVFELIFTRLFMEDLTRPPRVIISNLKRKIYYIHRTRLAFKL